MVFARTTLSVLAALMALSAPSHAQSIRLGPGGVEITPEPERRVIEVEPEQRVIEVEPDRRDYRPERQPEYRSERRPAPRDELRERLFGLRRGCQEGDRRACVRMGIIIGENRDRVGDWRRENPDMFFYER